MRGWWDTPFRLPTGHVGGERPFDPGEREQVGFRPVVDILHRWWEPTVEDVVARNESAGEVWAQLREKKRQRERRARIGCIRLPCVNIWR